MAEDSGKLSSDPLFLGLTRPTMIFGVSFHFFFFNMFVGFISFIQTSNFMYLVGLPVILHGVAYVICFKEPLFLQLYSVKLGKFNKCKNKMFHGYTNSYDMY